MKPKNYQQNPMVMVYSVNEYEYNPGTTTTTITLEPDEVITLEPEDQLVTQADLEDVCKRIYKEMNETKEPEPEPNWRVLTFQIQQVLVQNYWSEALKLIGQLAGLVAKKL